MHQVTPESLQAIEELQHVPADQLQWLIDNSRHHVLQEGEYLFRSNEAVVGTHIILTGKIRIYLPVANGIQEIGFINAGEVSGYLPFSHGFVSRAMGQIVEESKIMTFPIERIRELIATHFELTQALVHIMTERVRDFTSLQQQNEKMMALGKLSAGLAHELNNPAAAIVRGSTSLKQHLQLQPATFKKVIAIRMSEQEVDAVNQRMFEVLSRKQKTTLTMLQRKSIEDDMIDFLIDREIENVDEIAENFVDFGFTVDDMENFSTLIPAAYLSPVLNWINNNLVTEKMVSDIQEASERISSLVSSVKNFTHMDRGQERELTDIHFGITNTLTMLQHKIRKANIKVVEDFDANLPKVNVYAGAMNQVWTNLIDNAIDAMETSQNAKLVIKTDHDKQFIKVSVADNGPGIDEEIKNRIFDPFFTTKSIGKGTGLGLDVVSRIIKQHNGSITVDSRPGSTNFVVCIPIIN